MDDHRTDIEKEKFFAMGRVPFTQYLRPNGRRRLVSITMSGELLDKAKQISDAGLEFEIEELSNGMVSMTVTDTHPETGGDLVTELCMNDSEKSVRNKVEKMIREFKIKEEPRSSFQ